MSYEAWDEQNKTSDTTQKYKLPAQSSGPTMGAGEAFVHGVGHGGALGFDDKVAGLVSAMLGARPDSWGGNDKGFSANYSEGAGSAQADNKQAANDQPLAYGAGQVAGAVPLYAAGAGLGASGARAVGAFPLVGRLVGAGAVGATQGAGETGTVKGAAQGAGLAMLGEGAGAAIGKGIGALANKGKNIASAEALSETGQQLSSRTPESISAAAASKAGTIKQSINDLLTDYADRTGTKPTLKDGKLVAPEGMHVDDQAFSDMNDQYTKLTNDLNQMQEVAKDPSKVFTLTQSEGADITKQGADAKANAIGALAKTVAGRSVAGLAPAYVGSQLTPDHPWMGAAIGEAAGFGAPEILSGVAKTANVLSNAAPTGTASALRTVGTASANPTAFSAVDSIVNPSGQDELSDEERIALSKMNASSAEGRAQNNPLNPLNK